MCARSRVTDLHIQVSLYCKQCGHEWDVDDYDAQSTVEAIQNAEEETCPLCEKED